MSPDRVSRKEVDPEVAADRGRRSREAQGHAQSITRALAALGIRGSASGDWQHVTIRVNPADAKVLGDILWGEP